MLKQPVEKLLSWGREQSLHPIRSISMFFSLFLPVGILIVGLTILLLRLADIMPKRNQLSWETLAGSTLLFIALIGTVFIAVNFWGKWLGFQGGKIIGLDNDYRKLLIGILWGIGIQLFVFVILVSSGWLRILNFNFESPAIINVIVITISSLGAGVFEEIIFRGVIYTSLHNIWNWWAAALLSAVLFALFHFLFDGYDLPAVAGMGLMAGGFLFAWTMEITKTIWIPIGIHFAWDAAIGWFNLTASRSPHILMTSVNVPKWMIGEWGLIDWTLLPVFALSIWLVGIWKRVGQERVRQI